ncbi:MAG: DnaA/Hda family protein [Parvibaculum sp.]|nr:DnaA/Hda family protein [Parvibaculum sp.]
MTRQLVFELGHRSAHGRDDFLVAPSNELAVALIDAWPAWPAPTVALSGPQGSGKTHLAEVWHQMSGAARFDASVLEGGDVPALVAHGKLIIEDIGALSDLAERTLFHLLNLVKEDQASMLLTSRDAPAHLATRLPDLASRLKALPHAALGVPDDALLAGVLVKFFDDRQLRVGEPLITYLASRIERSIAIARDTVEALDRASLSGKRPITVPLAAQVLDDLGHS